MVMKGCLGFDLRSFLLASEHLQVLMGSADDVGPVLQAQLHLCELLFRFAHYFLTRYMATYFFRVHLLSPAFVVAVAEFSRLARCVYARLLSDFEPDLTTRDRKLASRRVRTLERLRGMVGLDCHLPRGVAHWQHVVILMFAILTALVRAPGAAVPHTPFLIAFGVTMVPCSWLGVVRVFQTSSKMATRVLVRAITLFLVMLFNGLCAYAGYLWWDNLPLPQGDPLGFSRRMVVLAGGMALLPVVMHGRMAFYDANLYVTVEKWGKQDS